MTLDYFPDKQLLKIWIEKKPSASRCMMSTTRGEHSTTCGFQEDKNLRFSLNDRRKQWSHCNDFELWLKRKTLNANTLIIRRFIIKHFSKMRKSKLHARSPGKTRRSTLFASAAKSNDHWQSKRSFHYYQLHFTSLSQNVRMQGFVCKGW